MRNKAIALISGGLDSLLAARIVKDQGIGVLGVVFIMQFASRDLEGFKTRVEEAAGEAGIPVRFVDISGDFLKVLRRPEHGYGANINPCIDCKILMLRKAKKIMQEEGARFVLTGEVLGERPMSQRKAALDIIEKRSGLKGRLLRPLSARLMKETEPEKEGIVEREKLLDIRGRSREAQLALAGDYRITKFFSPSGGCLLTDPVFSRKIEDLVRTGTFRKDEISLLKYGRHFRLDGQTKVIVGRNEKENDKLLELKKRSDMVFRLKDKAGPYALLRGETSRANIEKAASLVLGHSRYKKKSGMQVEYWSGGVDIRTIPARTINRDKIDKIRI
ncbi:MAG: DUF814 domain-containing protein [Candidatus Omnitrophica bacterium]|nr:DUF814 domain-containing protein [Candidatus Omnitrophota bacterium]